MWATPLMSITADRSLGPCEKRDFELFPVSALKDNRSLAPYLRGT